MVRRRKKSLLFKIKGKNKNIVKNDIPIKKATKNQKSLQLTKCPYEIINYFE